MDSITDWWIERWTERWTADLNVMETDEIPEECPEKERTHSADTSDHSGRA